MRGCDDVDLVAVINIVFGRLPLTFGELECEVVDASAEEVLLGIVTLVIAFNLLPRPSFSLSHFGWHW